MENKHYEVYAFGSNGSGQLALGHREDVAVPELCKFQRGEKLLARPKRITAGGNHTLLLCEDGIVFATGSNEDGRCALAEASHDSTMFQRVEFQNDNGTWIRKFIFISATWESSTLIAADGTIYTCGTGLKGELGQGGSVLKSNSPRIIPNFPPSGTKVVHLTACMSHTVVVLSDGQVYGWGSGRQGQLGEPADILWSPRKIAGICFPVVHASCGRDFTHVLGSAVDGRHAILGSDKWHIKQPSSQNLKLWCVAEASWGGIQVLLKNGKLIGWGRNDHGQHPPNNLAALKHIAVGSEHTLADDGNGSILAWGWGEHGNCGNPHAETPTGTGFNIIITGTKMSVLGAGCATSWLWGSSS